MRLIQLNIWEGKLKYQLVEDFLPNHQADIICMQEVNDVPEKIGPLFASLDEIATAGDYAHKAMAPVYSFGYMGRQLHFGNATISKHSITSEKVVFTHGEYNADYNEGRDEDNSRNFLHTVVDIDGKSLHVLNYHGYYIHRSKEGDETTMNHMRMIGDYIKQLSGPVILAGDFNLKPGTASMEVLNSSLRNLSIEAKLENTYTLLSHHNFVCDYIFTNDAVTVISFEPIDMLVSDHVALALEFEL